MFGKVDQHNIIHLEALHVVLHRHATSVNALEVFVRREDAERFIEEVRGDDPDLASYLRIEERELEADGRN